MPGNFFTKGIIKEEKKLVVENLNISPTLPSFFTFSLPVSFPFLPSSLALFSFVPFLLLSCFLSFSLLPPFIFLSYCTSKWDIKFKDLLRPLTHLSGQITMFTLKNFICLICFCSSSLSYEHSDSHLFSKQTVCLICGERCKQREPLDTGT